MMGQCLCKEKRDNESSRQIETYNSNLEYLNNIPSTCLISLPDLSTAHAGSTDSQTAKFIDNLILETLSFIRTLVDNDQDPPDPLIKLHFIADNKNGWLAMVNSMVNVIPLEEPVGPAVITLLLDDCPLPSRETVVELTRFFKLSKVDKRELSLKATKHRNITVVLSCMAEKMAGLNSVAILTEDTLNYLLKNLDKSNNPSVILFSLIALEKFAQTTENKVTINKALVKLKVNPLLELEKQFCDKDYIWQQVGFCSQWCLDNLFLVPLREFTYSKTDNSKLNAMLNNKDVSEYLKISADGLQARCDAASFESVRCTFQADFGVWYYEVKIVTAGVMQIGWATKESKFLNHEGYGIGDDEYSLSYDGCRQLIWHNAGCEKHDHPCWKPGDVVGFLLDLDKYEIIFSLNGSRLLPCHQVFENTKSGFFAAASFMSFQQCQFNFGSKKFIYPPSDRKFSCFNEYGELSMQERTIYPRHMILESLRQTSVQENSCTLCCDNPANITIEPCGHMGFCGSCVKLLELCPICRQVIVDTIHLNERGEKLS